MTYSDIINLSLKQIHIAHEYTLDSEHKCEYLNGRGVYGLVLGISGEAEYRFLSGERRRVSSGDVMLIRDVASYSIYINGEFRHYTLNFDIHEKESCGIFSKDGYCFLHAENSEQYKQIFKKLVTAWISRDVGYEMLCASYSYEMLSMLSKELYDSLHKTKERRRLRASKDYIEKHFDKELSLDLLAKLSDMSVTNFRREWSKIYKNTPLQYRDRIRVSYAKELLISGYYSVSEVAERCGFKDTSYFVRYFKKHVGVSPGVFKSESVIL